jgi:hypothetical protein
MATRGDKLDAFFERQRRRILADLYPNHKMRQSRTERDAAGNDLDVVATELSDRPNHLVVRK